MEELSHSHESQPTGESTDHATSNKRPRSPSNDLPPPSKVAKTSPSLPLQINYLQRLHTDTLPIANADDSLSTITKLISEYDGVLQRHESIAGNLGACPLGPILLKRFERLFDGPPHILKSHGKEANVTWLDVVDFARNKPEQFNLEKTRNGVRVCQFYTKQCRVEISEEDFVLIDSGMPQKLIPPQPIMEDEEKELSAIHLLEKNLAQIVYQADNVSARARQLNHKLGNRKQAILRRRESAEGGPGASDTKGYSERSKSSPLFTGDTNGFSKQRLSIDDRSQSPPSGFTAVNVRQSIDTDTHEPDPRLEKLYTDAGNVTILNGQSVKGVSPTVRAALVRHFLSKDRKTRTEKDTRRSSSFTSLTPGSSSVSRPMADLVDADSSQLIGGSTVAIPSTPASLLPQMKLAMKDLDDGGPFKSEMVRRIESMQRGERVLPPCDRCRRLHMDCLKNLTACMGCTKKHAKCSWKDVRVEELQRPGDESGDGEQAVVDEGRHEEMADVQLSDVSPRHGQFQPLSDAESKREAAGEKEELNTPAKKEGDDDAVEEAERPRFDVRPPPMAQQQANGRGQYTPFSYYPQVKDSIEHTQDENDEGDRLQALAAQVYRSASQSIRPQEG